MLDPVKVSQLPVATSSQIGEVIVVVQNGVTKQMPRTVLKASLLSAGMLLYGTDNPPGSETGVDGDSYINEAEKLIWGPKAAGVWPAPINLKADGLYKVYATLAAANADLTNIPADKGLVWVNADPTPANCGYWAKTGGVLVQSGEGGFLALQTATEAATAAALAIANQALTNAQIAAGAVTSLLQTVDPFPQYNLPGENGFLQLRLFPTALDAASVGFYQPFMVVSVVSAVLTKPVGGFGLLGGNIEITFDAVLDPATVSNVGNSTGSFEVYDLTANAYLPGALSTTDNIIWTFNPTVDLIDTNIIQVRIAQTVATPAPERGYDGTILSFIAVVEIAPNTAPTISVVADDTTPYGTAFVTEVTIGDAETPVANLTMLKSTSDVTILPLASIVWTGTGSTRTATCTPSLSGPVTVGLGVTDGNTETWEYFVLTVAAPITYTDNFNRANGDVGASWTTISGQYALQVNTNQVAGTASGMAMSNYNGALTNNQFAQVDIVDTASVGVLVRSSDVSVDNYLVIIAPTTAQLFRGDAGSYTQLGSTITIAIANIVSLRLEAVGDVITLKTFDGATWTDLVIYTDSSGSKKSSGKAGMRLPTVASKGDNFMCGDL